MSTYSPNDSYIQDKRLGIRVPRSVLLPPYISSNQYYVDFMDSVDTVLGPIVDNHTLIFENLRNMWVSSPSVESIIQNTEMIDSSDWPIQERGTLVNQAN